MPHRGLRALRVAGGLVTATHMPPDRVVLEWSAGPIADAVADSLVALLAQVEVGQASLRASSVPCGGGAGHSHEHADGDSAVLRRHSKVGTGDVVHAEGTSVAGVDDAVHEIIPAGVTQFVGDEARHGTVVTRIEVVDDTTPSSWPADELNFLSSAWAAAIAEKDTAFSLGTPDAPSGGAHAMATASTDHKDARTALPMPLRRRRDALLAVMSEQYGGDVVACYPGDAAESDPMDECGEHALTSAFPDVVYVEAPPVDSAGASYHPLPAFAIAVSIDATVAIVKCGSAPDDGFAVALVAAAVPEASSKAASPTREPLSFHVAAATLSAYLRHSEAKGQLMRVVDDAKLRGTLRRTVAAVDALFAPINFGT